MLRVELIRDLATELQILSFYQRRLTATAPGTREVAR